MKRIAGISMTIVFILVSAFGSAFSGAGAAEMKEYMPYNGITFFNIGEQNICAGHEGTAVADSGSKAQLFNGITFFDQSDERASCPGTSVKQGTWASNGITIFQ